MYTLFYFDKLEYSYYDLITIHVNTTSMCSIIIQITLMLNFLRKKKNNFYNFSLVYFLLHRYGSEYFNKNS
jgi:hypothetical protein